MAIDETIFCVNSFKSLLLLENQDLSHFTAENRLFIFSTKDVSFGTDLLE